MAALVRMPGARWTAREARRMRINRDVQTALMYYNVLTGMEGRMVRATGLAAGSLILLTMMVKPGGAAEQQFSCQGQVVQEMANPAAQPKPINLNVTLGDKNKLSMTTGDGKVLAPRITSNNKIQLKFLTKEFVGEYFHYTGDLFLIYNSGPLARLTCART